MNRSLTARPASLFVISAVLFFTSACTHDYTRWSPDTRYFNDILKSELSSLEQKKLSELTGAEFNNILQDKILQQAQVDLEREENSEKVLAEPYWTRLLRDNRFSEVFDALKINGLPSNLGTLNKIETDVQARKNRFKLEAMYSEEFDEIDSVKKDRPHAKHIGLALSGGGIRSASYALGVLQGLHEAGMLDDIGYLSTVSGGGYAGSWYMLHNDAPGLLDRKSRHSQHVVQNGYYLVSAHASKAKTELVRYLGYHFCLVPFHWIINGIFDLDRNMPCLDELYRRGIERAYQYEKPFSPTEMFKHDNFCRGPTGGHVKMCDLKPTAWIKRRKLGGPEPEQRPFWIINMHLVLSDDQTTNRNRSGDAFELTPLRAGADSIGYVKVPDADDSSWDGSADWMFPCNGVAISGAAVDSGSLQAGAVGNVFIDSLNLNLGRFVDGWDDNWMEKDGESSFSWHSMFYYLTSPFFIYGIPSPWKGWHKLTKKAKRLYLTDGGHFDNTGIYSLVRRGCRLIIFSDATHDPLTSHWNELNGVSRASTFQSLREVEYKLLSDFGTEMEIEWDLFDPLGAKSGNSGKLPKVPTILRARIRNLPILTGGEMREACDCRSDDECRCDDVVTILCIKAAYKIDEDNRSTNTFIDGEKRGSPQFPHDTTLNQFYTEQQILSYSTLGRETVLGNIDELNEEFGRVERHYSSFKKDTTP